jgi:predicted Rossmann-fold nucleotide-binding protein
MKYFWKATLAIRRVLHVAASHARFPSRYRALHFIGPCVTVFGSARIKPDDPHYKLALKMGAAIARLGFTVMTGGGQGGYGGGPTAAQKRSAAIGLDATSSCHSRNHPTYVSIVVSGCIIFSFAKRC